MTLNDRQQEAVLANCGPLMIIAGPGTGKTHTLTAKITHLITELKIPPGQILAVTFTQSAAKEMRRRLASMSPSWTGTFHAIAAKILRQENYPFGPGIDWSIAAESQKNDCLDGLILPRSRRAFLDEIRNQKTKLQPPSGNHEEYYRRLVAARLLDFDDVLLHVGRLFEERPQILTAYQRQWSHILVDEFQDTSPAQYQLLKFLACPNTCVIGDPDQAIYGFTGDDFKPFDAFEKDHPACRKIILRENYRSQPIIVTAASQIIAKNSSRLPRELQARLEEGLPVEIASYQNERQEAEMTVRRIEHLLGGSSSFMIDTAWARKEKESYSYSLDDIAILYRFHAQSRALQNVLDRSGLPYKLYAKKSNPEASGGEDLEDFQDNDHGLPQGEGVTLMTLHRAKGLEFPVVLITGMEQGMLPWPGSALEEERRLFYVGVTRAKSRLFLSWAKNRFLFGKTLDQGPSPFLSDIEKELRVIQENEVRPRRRPTAPAQPTLF